MKYLISLIFLFCATSAFAVPKEEHRLTGGECAGMAHVYFLAAMDRDKGNTLEWVMHGMEETRDSAKPLSDSYIFDLVKAGVAYVFKTPNISPDEEGRNFLDYCNKAKGLVSAESDYFNGENL
jgi:hypothetical protein